MVSTNEAPEEKNGEAGLGSRIAGGINRVRQGVQRSSEVLTGSDIRGLDAFTDAVTRVSVGLHRNQAELREQVEKLEQSLSESRQAQAVQAERLVAVEQALDAHLKRNPRSIWERLWRTLTLRA